MSTLDLVAEHAGGAAQAGSLAVLLGPASELGRAVTARRDDLARAHLSRWRDVLGRDGVVVEVVCHRGPGDVGRAARMLGLRRRAARERRAHQRRALRRPRRRPDRRRARRRPPARARSTCATSTGATPRPRCCPARRWRRSPPRSPGPPGCGDEGRGLLARTRVEADRCAVDPRRDLGIGEVHFPELESGRRRADGGAARALRGRLRPAGDGPRRPAPSARLEDELGVISGLGYPSYFLTVADVVDLIKGMGVRVAARGSGAGSLVTYLLGISDVDPIRYGLLMERFLSPLRHQLPDIDVDVESARRMEVYEQILATLRRRALHLRVDDGHLPRPPRHPRRRRGARAAARRGRRARQGVPAHPGQPGARGDARPARAAVQRAVARARTPAASTCCCAWSSGSTGCRATSRCTPAACCCPTRRCSTAPRSSPAGSGFPMSQFDKDDVEELGLLKLDVLGIRMQSAMQHAVGEVERVDGVQRRRRRRRRATTPTPSRWCSRPRPSAASRSSRRDSASWSASSRRRPSRTSSSTSRCSGPGRSRATWSGPSSRRGRAGRTPTSCTPTSRRRWRRPTASSSSTSRSCRSSAR